MCSGLSQLRFAKVTAWASDANGEWCELWRIMGMPTYPWLYHVPYQTNRAVWDKEHCLSAKWLKQKPEFTEEVFFFRGSWIVRNTIAKQSFNLLWLGGNYKLSSMEDSSIAGSSIVDTSLAKKVGMATIIHGVRSGGMLVCPAIVMARNVGETGKDVVGSAAPGVNNSQPVWYIPILYT